MKKDIHPEYRKVVFHDLSADEYLIAHSTLKCKDTIEVDGTQYPLTTVDVSSASHPFYTGKRNIVDGAGRVDRFQKLTKRAQEKKSEKPKKKESADKKTADKKTLADLAQAA